MHKLDSGNIYNYTLQCWDRIHPDTDKKKNGVYTTKSGTKYWLNRAGTAYRNFRED